MKRFIVTEQEKKYIKGLYEQPDSKFDTQYNKEIQRKYNKPSNIEILNIDDTIDIVSMIIDGIPGIGNLVSAGIDIAHTLSYLIRFYFTDESDVNKKIEYGTLAFITLGATFIPVQGNSLPIMMRQGLSRTLSMTPQEILVIAKKLGLYNKTVRLLSKTKFKYSFLILLCKILGSEISERLNTAIQKINQIYERVSKIDFLADPLLMFRDLLKEFQEDISIALPIAQELSKQENK